jgi:AraC-like DNA-binding protein
VVDLALRRSATSVELLLALGVECGIARGELLAGTGLRAADLAGVDAEVTAGQELEVVRRLVTAVGDRPGAGLEAGGRYHLTTDGIWGFALVSSPTLRAAVEVGSRHLALTYALTEVSAEVDDPVIRVVLGDRHLPADVRRFIVERDVAALCTLQRELLGEGRASVAVRLRAAAPADPSAHRSVLGDAVTFGADRNEVVLTAGSPLDAPLPRADVRTATAAAAQCERLLEQRRRRLGVSGEVRQRLLRDPTHPPSMEEVAAERHVTERTLRRQLRAEGTGFRQLLDEVREALAHELLAVAGLGVEQTAGRVGFAEPASFVHAFRRWTGTTPGAYRDAHRRGVPAPRLGPEVG